MCSSTYIRLAALVGTISIGIVGRIDYNDLPIFPGFFFAAGAMLGSIALLVAASYAQNTAQRASMQLRRYDD